jgi:nicotinamide riboside kinase
MATDHDSAAAGTDRRRILCLTGPESTGKTTLAEALAAHFGAPLVPEMARGYLAGKSGYGAEDVLEIARLQVAEEARVLSKADGLVICDTDLLVIRVWWEEKFGELPDALSAGLASLTGRGYLLLSPDLEWQTDPLRENPEDRDRLFLRYEALLTEAAHPHEVVAGTGDARFSAALWAVSKLLPELD